MTICLPTLHDEALKASSSLGDGGLIGDQVGLAYLTMYCNFRHASKLAKKTDQTFRKWKVQR